MYIIKEDPRLLITYALGFFVRPWVAMLALGTIGHHYDNQFLMHLAYWDIVLANLALTLVRPTPISRYIIGKEK